MTTTLITGANNGLGFETARRLIALGHTVYLGARDRERGEGAAQRLGARFVPIDVTDDASVAAAAAWIERQKTGLDVLINNAGIAGDRIAPAVKQYLWPPAQRGRRDQRPRWRMAD
jgi:NAD(P)-dependent dehydrogenase (short-subunit alcohol dehydrogenase family)